MSAAEIQHESSKQLSVRYWWLPFLILIVAHLPFLLRDLSTTWGQSHYQFFPFAFIAFFGLLWSRQHSGNPRPLLIVGLIIVDMLLLFTSVAVRSPWLASFGFWHLLLALAISRKDRETGTSLAYLAFLPFLAIRLPANTDLLIIQRLQDLTSSVASNVLNLIGCLHLRQGNVITLPSRTLLVEEACSGVQSLFTLLFLAVLICCWKRRSPFHAGVVLAGAVFFAGFMNVFRVIAIVLAEHWWQWDLTAGWLHDVVGYVVLGISAGLVYNFDYFLLGFTATVPDNGLNNPDAVWRNPYVAAFNQLFATKTEYAPRGLDVAQPAPRKQWKLSIIVSSILCIAGIAAQTPALLSAKERSGDFTTDLDLLTEVAVDSDIAGFVRQKYTEEERRRDDIAGQYSNTWAFQNQNMDVTISCDHLFLGWHDLRVCYTGIGWQVSESELDQSESVWHAMRVRLVKPDLGYYGLLFFSFFTASGEPFQPPDINNAQGLVQHRLGTLSRLNTVPNTIQCQTFVESPIPFTDDQIELVRRFHLQTRQQIKDAAVKVTMGR